MNRINLNLDFCCACLKLNVDEEESFVRLSFAPLEEVSYKNKLKACIPEIQFGNTNDCMLCEACSIALENAYTFRCMCLQNENKLKQFRLSRNQNREAVEDHIKAELMEQLSSEELNAEHEELNMEHEEDNLEHEVKYFVEPHHSNKFSESYFAQPEEYSGMSDDIDPIELEEASNSNCSLAIPEKSRKRYEVTYSSFKRWSELNNVKCITQEVVLSYFFERSKILKSPASLWSEYSMLKTTIFINDNVDISTFRKVVMFLKIKNRGYQPKKAKAFAFAKEDIDRFLTEAPDHVYLMMKVVMIMGVAGGCRREELCNMTIDDIEDRNSVLIVKIPDPNTKQHRTFTIINRETEKINFIEIYRKYVRLRPKSTENRRFFLQYQSGKCTSQAVGKNAVGKIPTKIAEFLNLKNPHNYTVRSFRRTSSSLLTSTGIDVLSKL